jgi:hypothetical protein
MKIEGSLRANLVAAVASARRLKDRPVHDDTLQYWRELLEYARGPASETEAEPFGDLADELEAQLADRVR